MQQQSIWLLMLWKDDKNQVWLSQGKPNETVEQFVVESGLCILFRAASERHSIRW